MDVKELVALILDILGTHNEGRQSMDQFVTERLSKYKTKNAQRRSPTLTTNLSDKKSVATITTAPGLDNDSCDFVRSICCGVHENKSLLEDCANLLYGRNPQLRPSQRPYYCVLFYYLLFELEDGSFGQLKKVLDCESSPYTAPFLQCVYGRSAPPVTEKLLTDADLKLTKAVKDVNKPAELDEDLRNVLEKYLDGDRIEEVIETVITDYYDQAMKLLGNLTKTFKEEQAASKETVKFDEFNVTKRKPEPGTLKVDVVEEDEIESSASVDEENLKKPTQAIMDERQKTIKDMAGTKPLTKPDSKFDKLALHKGAKKEPKQPAPFEPQVEVKKREKKPTKDIIQQQQIEAEMRQNATVTGQLPQLRMNKNQILKENALLEKKLQAEAEEIKAYVAGERDSAEFERWRAALEAKDKSDLKAKQEINKLRIKKLKEVTKESMGIKLAEKQQEVQEFAAQNLQIVLDAMLREQQHINEQKEENKAFADELQKNIDEAKAAILKEKTDAANELKQQVGEMKKEAKGLQEIQLMEKQNLIKQIKAMLEVQSAARVEYLASRFDPSEQTDFGFLNQMCLAELRERLTKMKEYQLQLLEQRRKRIDEEKQKEEEQIREKAERIEQMKKAISLSKEQKRIGESLYQEIARQVERFAKEMVDQFNEAEEQRRLDREKTKQQLADTKAETDTKVNELKDKLKQLREGKQTGVLFKAADVETIEKNATKLVLNKEPTKRAPGLYGEVQKQKLENEIKLKEEEFKRKKEQVEADRIAELERKKKIVQKVNTIAEQKQKDADLRDPFKAKMKGRE